MAPDGRDSRIEYQAQELVELREVQKRYNRLVGGLLDLMPGLSGDERPVEGIILEWAGRVARGEIRYAVPVTEYHAVITLQYSHTGMDTQTVTRNYVMPIAETSSRSRAEILDHLRSVVLVDMGMPEDTPAVILFWSLEPMTLP
jgi:hypothetical protein